MDRTLASPAGLDAAQLDRYRADGFHVVRRFLADTVISRLQIEARGLCRRIDLIRAKNLRCRWQLSESSKEMVFDAFDPVVDISPASRELATSPRLRALLRSIYDDEPVLFRDKLIFKQPGSYGYELHQDRLPIAVFPESCITVIVPLDPATPESGCVEVVPGAHREGYHVRDPLAEPRVPQSVADVADVVPLELEPGDIALFSCFTPHRSAPNRSRGWRRQLYLSFNAASDGGDQRERAYREYRAWLRQRFAEAGTTDMYFL